MTPWMSLDSSQVLMLENQVFMGVLVKSIFRYEGVVYMTPCVVDSQHMYTSFMVVFINSRPLLPHDWQVAHDNPIRVHTHPWFLLCP